MAEKRQHIEEQKTRQGDQPAPNGAHGNGAAPPAGATAPAAAGHAPQMNWPVLAAVGTGTFMSALDGSIVNTILPVLTRAFDASVPTIEWVVTVYLLVVSGLLLSVGRWGDLHGHKRTYVSGFGVFIAASVVCGLSQSATMLIASRGVQAVGAAALYAMSPAILTRNFPPERRGQVLGLQATMTYLGLTVGPLLGGWLATNVTWRAVFYINVPVCALALWLSLRYIPRDRREARTVPFDLLGAGVFLLGLIALLLALNQGDAWGWSSAPILGLLAFALVALAFFVSWELRVPHPMLDLSLFARRVFSAATGSAFLNYISIYSIVFVLPFYLIQGRGMTAEQAGIVLSAQPIVMAIAAPLSGMASDHIGTRLPAMVGMAILALGLFMLSRLTAATPTPYVALALAVSGLGTGMFISPNNSALMGSAPGKRQGIASGVLATARNVGMVVGVGLSGAIFTSVLSGRALNTAGDSLYAAVRAAFLAASGVAAVGVLTSAVRGRH